MLTRAAFNQGCQEFTNHSNQTNRYAQGWKWKNHETTFIVVNQELGYLYNEPIDRKLFSNQENSEWLQGGGEVIGSPVNEHQDEAGLLPFPTINQADHQPYQPIKYKASVVYSDTYQVPQLLFQAYKPDGTHLELPELIKTDIFYAVKQGNPVYPLNLIVQGAESSGMKNEQEQTEQDEPAIHLPILTRTIHPLENQPYWGLHPCNTQAALKDILDNNEPLLTQHHNPRQVIECFFALISSLIKL